MFVILWEFRTREKSRAAFLRAYGNQGQWVRLFRKAPGYLGTRLLADPDDHLNFFTLDCWQSAAAFCLAKQRFQAEYRALDAVCERLTRHERRIGSFRI